MNAAEIAEIIDALPRGKTSFLYFKDRYALALLAMAIDEPVGKADIRRSPYARLLDKATVKEALNRYRQKPISADILNAWWPAVFQSYVLTLDTWGSGQRDWDQTTRPGQNLVLQLNFSKEHERAYLKAFDNDDWRALEFDLHPIVKSGRKTLAWARLDIDLRNGEALIEELQSDWVRYATTEYEIADNDKAGRAFRLYFDQHLEPHLATWDEALLTATLQLLRQELGIERIFYHTHHSGAQLKRIKHFKPPRSLYTSLPRRFCFRVTDEKPTFLQQRKHAAARAKLADVRFYCAPPSSVGSAQ